MAGDKPYARQHINCSNCSGLGAIGVMQDGEMRYGQCLCAAGENYKGMPTVSGVQYPFKSDRKMVSTGEQVEGDLDF
jgi:hypothetical protein